MSGKPVMAPTTSIVTGSNAAIELVTLLYHTLERDKPYFKCNSNSLFKSLNQFVHHLDPSSKCAEIIGSITFVTKPGETSLKRQFNELERRAFNILLPKCIRSYTNSGFTAQIVRLASYRALRACPSYKLNRPTEIRPF